MLLLVNAEVFFFSTILIYIIVYGKKKNKTKNQPMTKNRTPTL